MNKTSEFKSLRVQSPDVKKSDTFASFKITETMDDPSIVDYENQLGLDSQDENFVDPLIHKHLTKKDYTQKDIASAFGKNINLEDIDSPRKYPLKPANFVKKKRPKNLLTYMEDQNIDFTGLERKRLKIDTLFQNDIFGCYFLQHLHPELVKQGAPKVHPENSYSVIVQSSECFVYKLNSDFFKYLLSYEKGSLLEDIMVRDVPNLIDNVHGRKNTLLTWLAFQDKVLGDIVKRKGVAK